LLPSSFLLRNSFCLYEKSEKINLSYEKMKKKSIYLMKKCHKFILYPYYFLAGELQKFYFLGSIDGSGISMNRHIFN